MILLTKLHIGTELDKSDEELLFNNLNSDMEDHDNKTLKENTNSKNLLYIIFDIRVLHCTGIDSIFLLHLHSAIIIAVTKTDSSYSTGRSI